MKTVRFVGVNPPVRFDVAWGGSVATSYYFAKAFEGDAEWKLEMRHRASFESIKECREYLEGGDVSHIDDTGTLDLYYKAGFPAPDVIGPISRSPVKNYKGWECPYPEKWFYKAQIVRLNQSEERKSEYIDYLNYIRHGVDPNSILDIWGNIIEDKTYILWAGARDRFAKNYEMWTEIRNSVKLPAPYEFKELTNYPVGEYWKVLRKTALLINTSRWESFCCAMFEAKCMGIPTIYKWNLHGNGFHTGSHFQVNYDVLSYCHAIIDMINNDQLGVYGDLNYEYCKNYASLKGMRDSYVEAYKKVVK